MVIRQGAAIALMAEQNARGIWPEGAVVVLPEDGARDALIIRAYHRGTDMYWTALPPTRFP
jgi:hypothetical protein